MATRHSKKDILVITSSPSGPPVGQWRGTTTSPPRGVGGVAVEVATLTEDIGEILSLMRRVFEEGQQKSGLLVDTVEVALSFTASGKIGLLAVGGEFGSAAAIKVVIKPRP